MFSSRRAIINLRLALRHAHFDCYRPLASLDRSNANISCLSSSALLGHNSVLEQLSQGTTSEGKWVPWWAVAGIAAVLAQGTPSTAFAEEQAAKPSDPHSDNAAIGNQSTAQWRLYTNIGNDHWRKGRRAEAERYLKRALQEAVKGFGPTDPHVAAAQNNLAELYRLSQEYEKAEPLYRQALLILEAAYGSKDPRYATALQHVAGFYQSQGQFPLARQYYQLALKALDDSLGKSHPAYARALTSYAEIGRLTDKKPEAIALLQQALTIQDALGPPSANDATHTASKLGQLLLMDGQNEEGITMLRRCVQQAESMYPEGTPQHTALLPMHYEVLAEGLQRTGDLVGARELLHKSIGLRTGKGSSLSAVTSLLVKTAGVELQIGERDSYLRAHNLALQAVERYSSRWEQGLRARERLTKTSWWWSSETTATAADLARLDDTLIQLAVQYGRAGQILATAQVRLGRVEEAKRILLATLAALSHSAAQPSGISGALVLKEGKVAPALDREVRRLQATVDVLYCLVRLIASDEQSMMISSVRAQLHCLRERFPRLEHEPLPELKGITVLGGQVWHARRRLNLLQNEINARKKSGAA